MKGKSIILDITLLNQFPLDTASAYDLFDSGISTHLELNKQYLNTLSERFGLQKGSVLVTQDHKVYTVTDFVILDSNNAEFIGNFLLTSTTGEQSIIPLTLKKLPENYVEVDIKPFEQFLQGDNP